MISIFDVARARSHLLCHLAILFIALIKREPHFISAIIAIDVGLNNVDLPLKVLSY